MAMRKVFALVLTLSLGGCALDTGSPAPELQPISLGQTAPNEDPSPTTEASASEQPSEPLQTPTDPPPFARDRFAEIDIEDQAGDGRSVSIDEIEISGGNSFLVIYDSTGLVLASALVTAQSQPVKIKLDYPLESSQELEAALYLDDGDGEFSLANDYPILDDEDELVHEDFYYRITSDG